MRKICSTDREKLLKFEAEGREFAKVSSDLISTLEQLEFKLKKIIGIYKHAGKFVKCIFLVKISLEATTSKKLAQEYEKALNNSTTSEFL